MKLVVQRVLSASVTVDGAVVSSIGRGLLVLCGLSNNEEADSAEWCCRRLLGVKLWPMLRANLGSPVWVILMESFCS